MNAQTTRFYSALLAVRFVGLSASLVAGCGLARKSSKSGGEGGADSLVGPGETASADDTAWMADLPVYECPGPDTGAIEATATIYQGSEHFYPNLAPATGYYMDLIAVTYPRKTSLDSCVEEDWIDTVVDGTVGDYPLFSVDLTMPGRADAVDYQGSYPDTGAPSWGPYPSMNITIGWYHEDEGYDTVVGDVGKSAGLCLSRVRPKRLSGTVWWTPPDRHPEWGGPFYFTFDVGPNSPNPSERCWATLYDYGLTQDDLWPPP